MSKPPDFGPAFYSAGRCFMYLIWLQSRLADFLCIRDAQKKDDLGILRKYDETQQTGRPSLTYHKRVNNWSTKTLGMLIEEFLNEWPEYNGDADVSHAFKIIKIHRNAMAHAYIGNSDWFVFKPNQATRGLIKDTGLLRKELEQDDPDFALLYPWRDKDFVESFYKNIRLIDFACFAKVAEELGVKYVDTLADPDWPIMQMAPVTLDLIETPEARNANKTV